MSVNTCDVFTEGTEGLMYSEAFYHLPRALQVCCGFSLTEKVTHSLFNTDSLCLAVCINVTET